MQMNETQARTLREAHDGYVKRISRLTKTTLAQEWGAEQANRGIPTVYGGPASKDELISALVELRYPLAKLNESIHVLYHVDGITNSACELCHPQHSDETGCDCSLGSRSSGWSSWTARDV